MAKLITMIFILLAIQAALIIFVAPSEEATPNTFWEFIMNVDNWNSTTFIIGFALVASMIGIVGIAAGNVFGFKTDFLILAVITPGLLTCGAIIINFWIQVHQELVSRVFTDCSLSSCSPATFLTGLIVGPIALYYVWTVIDWWRGRDM